MARVEFITVKAEEIKFGRNNFIEVARKVAKTEEGENEFISISKGLYLPENAGKRFRNSVSLPTDDDTASKVADLLKTI